MYKELLKFQQSHQCPQCGDSVRGGFNVPSVSLDWVCQDATRNGRWRNDYSTITVLPSQRGVRTKRNGTRHGRVGRMARTYDLLRLQQDRG
jgi:hypothetical protein